MGRSRLAGGGSTGGLFSDLLLFEEDVWWHYDRSSPAPNPGNFSTEPVAELDRSRVQ
jgi:hypothetical protein